MARRKSTALATTAEAPPILALALPLSAEELAGIQAEAEAKELACADLVCPTAEAYEVCQGLLNELVADQDTIVAMRQDVTLVAQRAVKQIQATCRPLLAPLERAETKVRAVMGDYLSAQAALERQAREAAAVAAETGDAETLVESLTVASAISHAPAQAHAWRWVLERVEPGLLPDALPDGTPLWVPDEAALKAIAKAAGSAEEGSAGDPRTIPGAIFRRVATVAAEHQ